MTVPQAYNRSVESSALERPQTPAPDSEKNQTVPAVKSAEFVSKVGPSGRPVGLGTFNPGVVGSNPTGPSTGFRYEPCNSKVLIAFPPGHPAVAHGPGRNSSLQS